MKQTHWDLIPNKIILSLDKGENGMKNYEATYDVVFWQNGDKYKGAFSGLSLIEAEEKFIKHSAYFDNVELVKIESTVLKHSCITAGSL